MSNKPRPCNQMTFWQYSKTREYSDFLYDSYSPHTTLYLILGVLAALLVLADFGHAFGPAFGIVLICVLLPIGIFKLCGWSFRNKAYPVGTVIAGIIIVTFLHLVSGSDPDDTESANTEPPQTTQSIVTVNPQTESIHKAFDVDVINAENHSRKVMDRSFLDYTAEEKAQLLTDQKWVLNVVVKQPPSSNEDVKGILDRIIEKTAQAHPDYDEISVYLFSDKNMLYNGADIGSAIWAPEGKLGNVTADIAANNDRSSYSTSYTFAQTDLPAYFKQRKQNVLRFGLSQAKRIAIYQDYNREGLKSDKAVIRWDKLHDADGEAMGRHQTAMDDLLEKKMCHKYHISADTLQSITQEGVEKHWPMGVGGEQ